MDIGVLEHLVENYPWYAPLFKSRILRLQTKYVEAKEVLQSIDSNSSPLDLFIELEMFYLEWRLSQVTEDLLQRIRNFRQKVKQQPLKEEETLFLLGVSYNIEANSLSDLGYLYKSINSHQKALEIFLKLNHRYFINLIINNLSYSFYQVGAFSLAKANIERILAEELSPLDMARTYSNLALVECSLGNTETALHLFQKANWIQMDLNAKRETSYTFFELFYTYYQLNNLKKMEEILHDFMNYVDLSDPLSEWRLNVCRALMQLSSNPNTKTVGIEQLIQIFWKSPNFASKFQVILFIVGAIISDPLHYVHEKELKHEISKIINHLYIDGLKGKSPLRFILLNVIHAALKLIEGDVISSSAIIDQCQNLVKKEGFPFIQPLLEKLKSVIDEMKLKGLSMPNDLHGYLSNLTASLQEQRLGFTEEKPLALAIYNENNVVGELVFDKVSDLYEVAKRKFPFEGDIQSLSQTVHAIIRSVGSFRLLYVAEGDPFISKQKLEFISSLIFEQLNQQSEWNVDSILHSSKAILLTSI
ncbi:MAG: hypothetical protein D6732_18550 [Methanobacteriota archaeon]|nr:MAG: hypothetical protein D6732_18550 [Euryarchaeota archaeon]